MKILFFGLGSIGQRHAKILKENYDFDLLAFRSGKNSPGNPLKIRELISWKNVEEIRPDAVFITNPTFMHIDTALKCCELNLKMFIEKPVDCSEENLHLLTNNVKRKELVTYIAYNLRFHPVIEYLKDFLKDKIIYNAVIYNSSYLPDWRPGTDHLKSYSANAAMGGGVILDLSHEFDYINYLFGPVISIAGNVKKASNVSVDAEDTMDAIIKTEKVDVNLHQDYLSLHRERTLKINCETGYIHGDLVNSRIEFKGFKKSFVKDFDSDWNAMYRKQIDYFLNNINNPCMMNNLADAGKLYKKILKFKKSRK